MKIMTCMILDLPSNGTISLGQSPDGAHKLMPFFDILRIVFVYF